MAGRDRRERLRRRCRGPAQGGVRDTLRLHGSLSLNWALMAAGLVDRLQITIFPVVSGRTGTSPVLAGASDFDLQLLESRTLDGRMQELVYRPTLR